MPPSPDGENPDDDTSLDDLIARLHADLAADPPDADIADLAAALGMALLDRYGRDGDRDTLADALAHLRRALDTAPRHADRPLWLLCLGRGYAVRGAARDRLDDYDRAIGYLSLLCADGPLADGSAHAEVAELLTDVYWSRWALVRRTYPTDVAAARAFVALFDEPDAAADDPAWPYRRMMAGVGLVDLYRSGRDRRDLDRGIAHLDAALRDPPAGLPCAGLAGMSLAGAYRERAALDEDPASLDLAIATGERAAGWAGDDDAATFLICQDLAVAYGMRWYLAESREDLDRAIGMWRAHFAAYQRDPVDPWKRADLGELLRVRGELDANLAEVTEAVTMLTAAAEEEGADPQRWPTWYRLGRAYHASWSVGRVPDSVERARACLERALRVGRLDDDDLVAVHTELYHLAGDGLGRYTDASEAVREAAGTEFRAQVDRTREVVIRAEGADIGPRASLALQIAYLEATGHAGRDLPRMRALLDVAERLTDRSRAYQAMLDYCTGIWQFLGTDADDVSSSVTDWGSDRLARAHLGADSVDTSMRDNILQALATATQARAVLSGDLELRRAAGSVPAAVRGGGQADDQGAHVDAETRALTAALALMDAHGDALLAGLSADITRDLEALPVPSGDAARIDGGPLGDVRLMLAAVRGELVDVVPVPPRDDELSLDNLPPLAIHATALVISALVHGDVDRLRAAVARLRAFAELTGPASVRRFGASCMLGVANLEIARRDPRDREAVAEAVVWATRAAQLAGGARSRFWPSIAVTLAEAERLAGNPDTARQRELGMSAIESYAYQVMLQAGTDDGFAMAGRAGRVALFVAGWCMQDHAYDDLVAVLDASRGLVLRATTQSREVADQLVRLDRPDLAERWSATRGLGLDRVTGAGLGDTSAAFVIPDGLRGQVLDVLAGVPGQDLFTGVRPAEIRASLAALGADALVYLAASDPPYPGTVVVVPASGEIEVLRLPGLTLGPDTPVHRFTGAATPARDAAPVGPDTRTWSGDLDGLCRWAWDAAMGSLVGHAARWRLGRPARLVLVPMGALGVVPWHAAYTTSGRGRHYAVRDAVFSYIPSARMLAGVARHRLEPTRTALVVGNPGGDLAHAGAEALAIHDVFYPFGTYLGQPAGRASGAGTPGQVRDWMAAASGPAVLHLACHGYADPGDPSRARLRLAGGDLTAADLVDAVRLAGLAVDRVFLAACTTNVTGTAYDEAFSLATVFLAAGARTVFGSLWAVPDAQTSLLMFMVHHFLNAGGLAPADALHAAQLWMLDPDRRVPARMPATLAARVPGGALDAPLAWAGFTHLGR